MSGRTAATRITCPSMTTRRRASLAAAILSVVALTGCGGLDKPTPGVTLFADGTDVRTAAASYCFEGQSAAQENCRRDGAEIPRVELTPGDQVSIDVDIEILERGWFLAIDGRRSQVLEGEHYFAFNPGPEEFGEDGALRLEIRSVDRDDPEASSGIWLFDLVSNR